MGKSHIAKVIRERRAVKKGYTDQAVSEKLVRSLLEDAIWAPTHGMRQPWRFIFVDKEKLPTFAKQVGSTYEEALQQNREDYLNEPNAILVVIMEEADNDKQLDENFGATSAMIQNFWLLAWEQQLGAVWKTNPHVTFPAVEKLLDVAENERIIGFVHLGYFDEQPEVKERISLDDKFTTYKG